MSAQGSPSDPAAIVEQLQTLTDIEGDLADTALAVLEHDQTQTQAQTEHTPIEGSESVVERSVPQVQDASGDADADAALLNNAEAVETVLESAIPDAPPSDVAAAAISSDNISAEEPVAAIIDTPAISNALPSSAATEEVSQTIAAVQADLNVPVLPEQVLPSAHDVPTETAVEEASSNIIVDVEEPTAQNIAEAVLNPENVSLGSSSNLSASQDDVHLPPQDSGIMAPVPTPAVIEMSAAQVLPPPVPASVETEQQFPSQSSFTDITLPEGLTPSSPSVVANRDLIYAYDKDPKSPMITLSLFNWAVQKTEIADARSWYEVLAVDNPTAVQPLLALINLELALSNFPQVEALFARALKGPGGALAAATDVSIWTAYLHYIRRQNPIADGTPNGETVRSTIIKAYEFALKECGCDRESGDIWDEYIKFVSEIPAKNAWETQAQSDNLRKLYQRAVCIPLNNIESLWKAYDAFESNLNKLTAKKFLAERSPAYMTARTALREMRALTDSLPRPILPPTPTFSDDDRRVVGGWKAYLKWEEGNPLVIEDEEILSARISYALRRCLSEMRHFPELWHYAASYYLKTGKKDEAAEVLKSGAQACPKSFLLTFALAESEEERKNYAECHAIFNALLDSISPDIDTLRDTITVEVEIARGPEIPGAANAADDVDMNGETSAIQKLVEEREERGKLVAERRGKDVEELQVGLSVVWIMFMRFARRAEGIKGARVVFGRARKSPHITWHVFEASAMMEYHSNKDSAVAIRIFELGFKLFSEDVDYVIRYLQFLLSINDDTNARALFERSAAKIPSDRSRPLWDTWARYEYVYGDLAGVHKLEQRISEAFPNDSPLKRFAQRYTYNTIDEIARRDLGFGLKNRPVSHAAAFPPVPAPGLGAPFAPGVAPGHATSSTPSFPPSIPAAPVGAPANSPGGYKRPAPDSPRTARRASVDQPSRSPKRYRANSPPGNRRYPPPLAGRERDRERDRVGSGSGGRYPPAPVHNGHGRDRSPITHAPPHGRRDDRSSLPPVGGAGTYGALLPPAQDRDRSGVGKPLAWFVGSLPSARSFDGPIFRPDDIIGLFSNITPAGTGHGPARNVSAAGAGGGYAAPPVNRGGGYPEPDRRYGAPPVRGGRY